MILGTVLLDLDRPHQGRYTTGCFPVQLIHKAIEQTGTIGIAATGRVAQY